MWRKFALPFVQIKRLDTILFYVESFITPVKRNTLHLTLLERLRTRLRPHTNGIRICLRLAKVSSKFYSFYTEGSKKTKEDLELVLREYNILCPSANFLALLPLECNERDYTFVSI